MAETITQAYLDDLDKAGTGASAEVHAATRERSAVEWAKIERDLGLTSTGPSIVDLSPAAYDYLSDPSASVKETVVQSGRYEF